MMPDGSARDGLIRLSTADLSVAVRPEVGCEIVELVDSRTHLDLLWKTPWGLAPGAAQTWAPGSEDFWLFGTAGGWNLLFPHAGAEREELAGCRAFHGEAGMARWRTDAASDSSATFSTVLRATPFGLLRRVSLEGSTIRVVDEITNRSPDRIAVSWGNHPTFSEPFIAPGVRIEVEAASVEIALINDGSMNVGDGGSWPFVRDIDLSTVPEDGRALLAYLRDAAPRYRIVNEDLDLAVTAEWSPELFPHLWLWQELRGTVGYPWFRRTYALAVEPHSTVPEGGPPSIVFEGGQRRESTMTLTLSAC